MMNTTRLLTVIIPAYNRLNLLKEAVESAVCQLPEDSELIVVDDGSDDGTAQWAENFTDAGESRFRCISVSHCGMPGKVRNTGVRESAGKYLAFLDSDDLWLPGKIEKQLLFLNTHRNIRICHTREKWLRRGTEVSQAGQKHRREGMIFRDALKKCIIGPSTVMMERRLFEESGGFREDLEIAEDYELWLRITDKEPVGYLDEPLTVKRAGGWDQLSEKYGQIEVFRIRGLKDLVDGKVFAPDNRYQAEKELVRKCRIYAAGCRKRGKMEEAEKYEALAGHYHPE